MYNNEIATSRKGRFDYQIFRGSSVVERSAVNADVTGSNPVLGATILTFKN